eukprot:365075-Chlamydomonas_euryale.AAC.7
MQPCAVWPSEVLTHAAQPSRLLDVSTPAQPTDPLCCIKSADPSGLSDELPQIPLESDSTAFEQRCLGWQRQCGMTPAWHMVILQTPAWMRSIRRHGVQRRSSHPCASWCQQQPPHGACKGDEQHRLSSVAMAMHT